MELLWKWMGIIELCLRSVHVLCLCIGMRQPRPAPPISIARSDIAARAAVAIAALDSARADTDSGKYAEVGVRISAQPLSVDQYMGTHHQRCLHVCTPSEPVRLTCMCGACIPSSTASWSGLKEIHPTLCLKSSKLVPAHCGACGASPTAMCMSSSHLAGQPCLLSDCDDVHS